MALARLLLIYLWRFLEYGYGPGRSPGKTTGNLTQNAEVMFWLVKLPALLLGALRVTVSRLGASAIGSQAQPRACGMWCADEESARKKLEGSSRPSIYRKPETTKTAHRFETAWKDRFFAPA